MESLNNLWLLCCISLVPISVMYFFYFRAVIEILKSRHPKEYSDLGDIGFVKNNTVANSNKFVLYILQASYKTLEDTELTKKANICRLLLIAAFSIFAAAFVLPIYIGYYA